MTIRFSLAAWDELVEAGAWLDQRRPGLGDEFLDEVEATLASIASDPRRFGLATGTRRRDVRRARVARFSYDVIFTIPNATTVRIVAVAHHSRKAGYWRKRL